jgi:hypothetical protein
MVYVPFPTVNRSTVPYRACYVTEAQTIVSLDGGAVSMTWADTLSAHDNFVMERWGCCGCGVTTVTIGA